MFQRSKERETLVSEYIKWSRLMVDSTGIKKRMSQSMGRQAQDPMIIFSQTFNACMADVCVTCRV
jgi:hypothetical protein